MATPSLNDCQQIQRQLDQTTAKSQQELRAQRQRNLNAVKKYPWPNRG